MTKQEPTVDQLKKLMFLASIDPEPLMVNDVRQYIEISKNYSLVSLSAGEKVNKTPHNPKAYRQQFAI